MRKLNILFALLLASLTGWGQANETFSNIPATTPGSYLIRSWSGDDGVTWSATQARTDRTLNGKAITISNNGSLYSPSYSNGMGVLTFNYVRDFTGTSARSFTVWVNGAKIDSIIVSPTSNTVVQYNKTVNVPGNVVLEIRTIGGAQIKFDDIVWTSYISNNNYRSIASGNYNSAATWQYFDSTTSTWTNATNPPIASNGVTISNGHTVTLTANAAADTLLVENGGTLDAATYTLTAVSDTIKGTLLTSHANGLAGTFTTLPVIDTTTATVEFNGANQIVSGGTYNNITFSTGDKNLGGAVIVKGVANFVNGIITTSATNLLTIQNTGSVTGGSTTAYVNGPLAKATNAVAAYLMPVGKGGLYRPVTVSPVSNTGTTYTVEYFNTAHANATVTAPLVQRSTKEYWDIARSGTDNANITLNWGAESGVVTPADVKLAHFNGTAWESLGGTATGTTTAGSVTVSGVSSFSPFTLGALATGVLPVNIIAFSGNNNGSANILKWTTAMERNNKGFEILHSLDGQTFCSVGFVNAKSENGNSVAKIDYTFTHNNVSTKNFYKLQQVDINGNTTQTGVITINASNYKQANIAVYPNPVSHTLLLNIENTASHVKVDILDMTGKIVISSNINVAQGANLVPVAVSQLTAGSYILKVADSNGFAQQVKFVKQ